MIAQEAAANQPAENQGDLEDREIAAAQRSAILKLLNAANLCHRTVHELERRLERVREINRSLQTRLDTIEAVVAHLEENAP